MPVVPDVPVVLVVPEPVAPDQVAPEAEVIAPAVAGPPIAALHPQPDAALAH